MTGRPSSIVDSLNELGAMGVVAPAGAVRGALGIDELCDQMARFGAEVGPHLTR